MPAGTLRAALEDFTQGGQADHSHSSSSGCDDFLGLTSGTSAARGLGRHLRAASFFDTESSNLTRRPRRLRAAFVKTAEEEHTHESEDARVTERVDEELERQDHNDHEVIGRIEKKVDDKLHHLREHVERKLDHFFKTMREAYGVPYGAPVRVPAAGGALPARAGSPPGGVDGQPWEGAKVRFHLPDLPPGKHATIQLERQQPVAVGGEEAGTQQEALGSVLKRLDTLMRKLSGQPPADVQEKEVLRAVPHPPAGSLGDLYHKLQMVRDNLSGAYQHDQPLPAAENEEVVDTEQPASSTEALQEQEDTPEIEEAAIGGEFERGGEVNTAEREI